MRNWCPCNHQFDNPSPTNLFSEIHAGSTLVIRLKAFTAILAI